MRDIERRSVRSESLLAETRFVHRAAKWLRLAGLVRPMKDWTYGCIAVTNEESDEIWAAVTNGRPIKIRP